jgi:hypothetical protein
MKIGEKYECDYLPDKTLVVTKIYNNGKMCEVSIEPPTDGRGPFLASYDAHRGLMLCLAHVFKEQCELRPKQEKITW